MNRKDKAEGKHWFFNYGGVLVLTGQYFLYTRIGDGMRHLKNVPTISNGNVENNNADVVAMDALLAEANAILAAPVAMAA